MISHHFTLVIQVATTIAETAEEEVGMETGAKAVIEEVVTGVLGVPSLPITSVSL